MIIDDDTPTPGALPDTYPGQPPVNLFSDAELAPANLFAFEGIDGTGKSELIARVSNRFAAKGIAARRLKLGSCDVTMHALERAKWLNANPMTINLLVWVSIFEQLSQARGELNGEALLFFDRYIMTLKIRGILEGLSRDFMDAIEAYAPRPRTVFLIDCEPEICLARILAGGRRITYFEAGSRIVAGHREPMLEPDPSWRRDAHDRHDELLDHLRRMRQGLFDLASGSDNVFVIDNSGDPEVATNEIVERIASYPVVSPTCRAAVADIGRG